MFVRIIRNHIEPAEERRQRIAAAVTGSFRVMECQHSGPTWAEEWLDNVRGSTSDRFWTLRCSQRSPPTGVVSFDSFDFPLVGEESPRELHSPRFAPLCGALHSIDK